MINPQFKVIQTAEDLQLVYRNFYNSTRGYSVVQGNCILWNSEIGEQEESALSRGLDVLKKMTSWAA
jgi:hypothetical protein